MSVRSLATIPAYVHITSAERDEMLETPYPSDVERPKTRGDCLPGGCNEERPCPFVGCKHHLYLDVNPKNGSIKLNFPELEVDQMAESCTLDVADRGGAILAEVGAALNLTRERPRQIEADGLRKLQRPMKRWKME